MAITNIKLLSFLIFCLPLQLFSFPAQDFSSVEYADAKVKSITFEKDGWKLAYPFLQPGSGDEMTLSFDIIDGDSAIVPVMLYDAKLAQTMADELLKKGIYVIGFFFPCSA